MNIFVGCSSRNTKNEAYVREAQKIGKWIARNNFNLVFGACEDGLMGEVYKTIKETENTKSKIIVAMSKRYEHQLAGINYDELHTYETLAARKEALINLSDMILILPGGLGTFDELLTAIESKRSGEHDKPIIIFNVNNYFNNILKLIDKSCKEGFIDEENRSLYHVVKNTEEMVQFFNERLVKSRVSVYRTVK